MGKKKLSKKQVRNAAAKEAFRLAAAVKLAGKHPLHAAGISFGLLLHASRRRCRHCAAAVPPTTATVTSAAAATNQLQSGMHPITGCLSALSLSSRCHPVIIFSFALSVFSFILAMTLRSIRARESGSMD